MPQRTVPSLSSIAEAILRTHIHQIHDVGDMHFDLIKGLLPFCTATQLREIELNSPHLIKDTEYLWKKLCVSDFVKIRIAVEDGKMRSPESWRELHEEKTIEREAQMEAATAKMRGAYHEHKNGRATAGVVDGVQMAKRRKLNAMVGGSARPKTLFEKAKVNSRRIGQIYAPPRRTTRAPVVTNASSAFFPTSTSSSRTPSSTVAPASPSRKAAPPTKVITVARTVRLPLPTPPPPPIRPISSLPNRTRAPPSNASSSTSSRPSSLAGSMSPPPVPLLPPPPPPPPAKSPGYAPGAVRASPAALNSLFLKPKARPSQRK